MNRTIAFMVLFLSLVTGATADTTTSSFTVSSVITSGCALGTDSNDTVTDFGAIDFGSMSSIAGNVDVASTPGAGSVIVTCTPGMSVSIALDYGLHGGSASERYLENSTTEATLGYQLYQDAAHSLVWGTDALAYSVASFPDTTQTYTIYGRLFPVTGLPASGTYTDTITVTLTY
ncbi:Csu type fimbrial protein [Tatumella citrea]